MPQKQHVMHGRDHCPTGADPIPCILTVGTGQQSVFIDTEAYVTLATVSWWQGVMARVQPADPGVAGGAYTFAVNPTGEAAIWTMIQASGTVADQIAIDADAALGMAAGDKIGITCVGDQIRGWIHTGGVWTNVVSATDDTWESGYLGIHQIQSLGRLDDFGGGVSSASLGDFDTPLLDSFDYPDEEPLSGGGNWTTRTPTPLKVVDGEVTQGGVGSTFAGAYWTPTGDAETGQVPVSDGAGGATWGYVDTPSLADEAVTPAKIEPGTEGYALRTVGGEVAWALTTVRVNY